MRQARLKISKCEGPFSRSGPATLTMLMEFPCSHWPMHSAPAAWRAFFLGGGEIVRRWDRPGGRRGRGDPLRCQWRRPVQAKGLSSGPGNRPIAHRCRCRRMALSGCALEAGNRKAIQHALHRQSHRRLAAWFCCRIRRVSSGQGKQIKSRLRVNVYTKKAVSIMCLNPNMATASVRFYMSFPDISS